MKGIHNMKISFSNKVSGLKPSAIREIFKSLSDPEVISFAAGNPSPLSFPVEKLKNLSEEIFLSKPIEALQYSITEGYPILINQINQRLKDRFQIYRDYDQTIITSGGQQGIDLTAKVLCNEGDVIICENPSFIGALNAFRAYNLSLVGIDMDNDGMNIEELESALKNNPRAKIIYTIPTFHNPMGITTGLEKRKAILRLATKYNVFILEDNPYGELRFAGKDITTYKSLDTEGRVIYTSSFSKILSAGMRVGYLCAHKEIIQKVVVAKQVNDVHTNIFFQMLVSKFIQTYGLDNHIAQIKEIYKDKRNLMVNTIEEYFDSSVAFTKPEGGLFIWVTLEKGDSAEFAKLAINRKVAIVPGTSFSPDESLVSSSFRLNYSTPTDDQIISGIQILGQISKTFRG